MSDDSEKPPIDNLISIDRDKSGRFKPGSVANRSGNRPQVVRDYLGNKLSIEELYQSNAGAVFYELIKLIKSDKTPPTAKISAIKEFNDRALGRPNQSLKLTAQSGDSIAYDSIDTSQLPIAVLQALNQARLPDRKA